MSGVSKVGLPYHDYSFVYIYKHYEWRYHIAKGLFLSASTILPITMCHQLETLSAKSAGVLSKCIC